MDIVNSAGLYSIGNDKKNWNSVGIRKQNLDVDLSLNKHSEPLKEKKEKPLSTIKAVNTLDNSYYLHGRLLTINQQLGSIQTELSEIHFSLEFLKNLETNKDWKSNLLGESESVAPFIFEELQKFKGNQEDWLNFLEYRQKTLLENTQKTQVAVENLLASSSSLDMGGFLDKSFPFNEINISDMSDLYKLNVEQVQNVLK